MSRRVEKFAELMQTVWASRNDYERRMREVRVLDPTHISLPSFDEILLQSFSQR